MRRSSTSLDVVLVDLLLPLDLGPPGRRASPSTMNRDAPPRRRSRRAGRSRTSSKKPVSVDGLQVAPHLLGAKGCSPRRRPTAASTAASSIRLVPSTTTRESPVPSAATGRIRSRPRRAGSATAGPAPRGARTGGRPGAGLEDRQCTRSELSEPPRLQVEAAWKPLCECRGSGSRPPGCCRAAALS